MVTFLFKAYVAAVLGGLNSLTGAIVGGVTLGVIDNIAALQFGSYATSTSLAVVIVVLIARPYGILGRPPLTRV